MSARRPSSSSFRYLTSRDIHRIVTMRDAIRVAERAFASYARARARMPAKVYLDLPEFHGDFRAMPAFVAQPLAAGVKWVSVHVRNTRRGLPTVMAMILLNDPRTGAPLALLDGTSITQIRTGAAGGVAAKYLARRESRIVALVGCGQQAISQLAALRVTHRLTHARVWGPTRRLAQSFIRRVHDQGLRMTAASTVRDCVRDADIVVTTTPTKRPLVRAAWLQAGVHMNAIGADAPGKQELAWDVLRGARIYVDEWIQAAHGGEINRAVRDGWLQRRHIAGSLGGLIIGKDRGRRQASDRTVFDSTGLAIQDVALAAWIYRQAITRRIGRPLTLP